MTRAQPKCQEHGDIEGTVLRGRPPTERLRQRCAIVSILIALLSFASCSPSDKRRSSAVPEADSATASRVAEPVRVDSGTTAQGDSVGLKISQIESCRLSPGNDTIRYSSLRTAPISGDVSGYEVAFVRSATGNWRGIGGEAFGELAPLTPLAELALALPESNLRLGVSTLGPPTIFVLSVSCDSLWGRRESHASGQPRPITLLRVRP